MAENVDFFKGQLPLKGVVLCCTALPQDVRTNLAEAAIQMGAVHKLDLTSDVTHLIVGNITTPKYRYVAKERPDIKVLHPDWLEAVRASWMEGGDVDVEALERKHHFPPFTGLEVCVTGFGDIEQRDFISETVKEHGAMYHGDLTKVVTHLIAAAPEGDKYTFAKKWGISTVSLKWFEDSLHRGMALDDSFYDPVMPIEEQGKGAFRRQVKQRTSLAKHAREGEGQTASSGDPGKKKLRRTASTRLEGHSQDMWSDMSAGNTSMEPLEADQWKDSDDRSTTHPAETNSGPADKTKTFATGSVSRPPSEVSEKTRSLFSGHYVLTSGFEQNKTVLLEHVLQQNGATIVQSLSELEDASRQALFKERCLLVPHSISSAPLNPPEVPANTMTVTEWWVERCIHYKRLLNPADDVLSQPLSDAKVPGFSDLLISTTGFVGVDLRQVAEAVKLMGATYQEKVLPTSSVLISGSASIRKEKGFYASKHNIPVVSAEWFWTCLRTKKKAPFEGFMIELPAFDLKDFTGEPSTSSPAASDILQKKADDANIGKDDHPPKRLSTTRKRHATPSLPLHATKANFPTVLSNPRPIVHEEEDETPFVDCERIPVPTATMNQKGSHPLQEVSPNLSPQKSSDVSTSSGEDTVAKNEKPAKPLSRTASPTKPASPPVRIQPLIRAQHELAADLAEIVNRQNTSRPSSAAPVEPPQRRKSRPLGRASSGISNRSLSASASAQSQNDLPFSPLSEFPESVSRGLSVEAPVPPSTQLGYETPEAEAHRRQMSKKMGTKLQDEYVDLGMRRVASLGVVKDSSLSAEAGVGNRVKGRKGRG